MNMSAMRMSAWKLSGIAVASAVLPFLVPRAVMAQDLCGQTTDADIVIMIDLTGSISNSALGIEKTAAKILLDVFTPATPRPRVAIGTFNGPCDRPSQGDCASLTHNARLLSELTDDYGTPGSGLFATIDGISKGPNSAQTDLSAAISVAQGVLDGASGPGRYIILISDGTPTIPDPAPGCETVQGSGANDFHVCECAAADNAALAAKDEAEAAGTQIFAIHFDDGSGFTCPGEPVGGTSFMRQLATTASTFFEGTDDLSGVFDLIAADIICDDDAVFCNGSESCVGNQCQSTGDPCVGDGLVCDEVTGLCDCDDDADCDDGNACTTDSCDAGDCANTAIAGCGGGGGGGDDGDDDRDGVPNADDDCPNTPADEVDVVSPDGCAPSETDDDGDGVPNPVDACPNTPADEVGLISPAGCGPSELDGDGDGVSNADDDCLTTPADETDLVTAQGCAPSELDDDGDGVANVDDDCADTAPGVAVDDNGCDTITPVFQPVAQTQPPAPGQFSQDDPGLCGLCAAGGLFGFMASLFTLLVMRSAFAGRRPQK